MFRLESDDEGGKRYAMTQRHVDRFNFLIDGTRLSVPVDHFHGAAKINIPSTPRSLLYPADKQSEIKYDWATRTNGMFCSVIRKSGRTFMQIFRNQSSTPRVENLAALSREHHPDR